MPNVNSVPDRPSDGADPELWESETERWNATPESCTNALLGREIEPHLWHSRLVVRSGTSGTGRIFFHLFKIFVVYEKIIEYLYR